MFADISLLRIVGLLVGVVLVAGGTRRLLRSGSGSRFPGVVRLAAGVGLLVIATFPDLVRPLQDILGLEGAPLGRLITVLIVAVALCFLLILYALGRAERASQRVGRLARALTAAQIAAPTGERWGGVLVCIPAFNEAESLATVLAEVPATVHADVPADVPAKAPAGASGAQAPAYIEPVSPRATAAVPVHVLVIDDGSRDGTADVARRAGVHVVSLPVNSGQGAALQTGYLVAERVGADVVVTMDADGQHDPAQLAALVAPILEDRADFVVGSRRLGDYEADSVARNAGITVYTRLLNALGGTEISDIANGFRAIRASMLPALAFTEEQFHNPELLLGAARAGFRVTEVPVTIRRRAAGTSKKGGTLRYGAGFLRVMLKTWLR
jgi:glycosyltransferase involved in cell wall biosynthesis